MSSYSHHCLQSLWFIPYFFIDLHMHMYYVVHSLFDLSKVAIHLSTYAHPIFEVKCRKAFEEMKKMVIEEVLRMPTTTSLAIALVVIRTFLSHHLFNEDGEGLLWNFLKVRNWIKPCWSLFPYAPLTFTRWFHCSSTTQGTWALFIPSSHSSPLVLMGESKKKGAKQCVDNP